MLTVNIILLLIGVLVCFFIPNGIKDVKYKEEDEND